MDQDCGGRKVTRLEDVDRLSTLPDEVISRILSLMPTKSSVRTSVLSKNWKNLWTTVPNLDFDCGYPHTYNSDLDGFVNFVDRVLSNWNPSQFERFRLRCTNFARSGISVDKWINKAISLGVSELDIGVHILFLPLSLFTCTTLTTLKFDAFFCDVCGIPNSIYLPNLKILHMRWHSVSEDLLHRIINSCPVIEEIDLNGTVKAQKNYALSFTAPTMKRLSLELCAGRSTVIVIDAPNLDYLKLGSTRLPIKIVEDFPSLVEASVELDNLVSMDGKSQTDFATELIRVISDVKYLTFVSDFLSIGELPFALPTFHSLTCLEMFVAYYRNWSLLPHLLESLPNLRRLSLNKTDRHSYHKEDGLFWIQPESVSGCLRSHLEEIKVTGFKGIEYELQVLQYLLGKATALKRLIIFCCGLTQLEEFEAFKNVSEIPTTARNCSIQFHTEQLPNLQGNRPSSNPQESDTRPT